VLFQILSNHIWLKPNQNNINNQNIQICDHNLTEKSIISTTVNTNHLPTFFLIKKEYNINNVNTRDFDIS